MSTFIVECSSCERKFKTLYSLNNHRRDRHEAAIGDFVPVFKDDKGIQVSLPKPVELSKDHHAAYIMWLAGLVERINSTFHPCLPGNIHITELIKLMQVLGKPENSKGFVSHIRRTQSLGRSVLGGLKQFPALRF